MIEARGLTKRYGNFEAITDVTFDVEAETIVGLLGPNGAGKTTAMKIITCFMPPTAGTARVCGHDIFEAPMEVKRSIGYLPEAPPVYPDLTVSEQLHFAAELKEVPARERGKAVGLAMEKTGVGHQARRLVGHLSKGYQQRVGIAQALVHNPPVLILDEPTVGLDPSQIREIRKAILELGESHTVILSTHILPEVSYTCQKVVIIDRGSIAAQGSIDDLTREVVGADLLHLEVRGPAAEVREALGKLAGVAAVEDPPVEPGAEDPAGRPADAVRVALRLDPGADVREDLSALLAEKTWPILELRPPGVSLEEVFMRITSRERLAAAPAPAKEDAAKAGDAEAAGAEEPARPEDLE